MTINNLPDWPKGIGSEAQIGVLGRFLGDLMPNTESSAEAILIQFLTAFSNIIGRGPHLKVEAVRHGLNLFSILVGRSSRGRKGTSLGHITRLFKEVDPDWFENRTASGLSSGEGLIWSVRDEVRKGGKVIADAEYDKRLLVIESEFASIIKNISREGNILSPILRCAWDGDKLSTLTKHSACTSTGAHISLISHITIEELLRYMQSTEYANGFGNRMLWACVDRRQKLPEGGDFSKKQFDFFIEQLRDILNFSKQEISLVKSPEAKTLWRDMYEELGQEIPGMIGALTSRSEPQVLRIAGLYALLDKESVISVEHLLAAREVWRYCEDSCRFIFGSKVGDTIADTILDALRGASEGLTRTEISHVFSKGKSAETIQKALNFLRRNGLAYSKEERNGNSRIERWALEESKSSNSTNSRISNRSCLTL